MARQTWAQLATLYPDNTAGAISPADLRAGMIDSEQPHEAAAAPTVNDDETDGFDTGHKWYDTSEPAIYECRDPSTGAAAWEKIWPQSAGGAAWGAITGTLGDQTDLDSALDAKADASSLATVATTGAYADLSGTPTLGTAAAANTGDFATAAQGGLADTATQPGDDAAELGSGAATDGYVLTADGAGGAAWEAASGGGGGTAWGGITGTLSDQTDLQAALDAKLAKSATVQSYAGNRTLDADNAGAYVRITAAGTVTLPDSLATGFQCVIVNATASDTVSLSAATTLTIPSGYNAEIVNRRAVTVIHIGSNLWEAHGALVESP